MQYARVDSLRETPLEEPPANGLKEQRTIL